LPQAPQCRTSFDRFVSHPLAAPLSQLANPVLHLIPQEVPSHVACAFGPVGHGEHDFPQVAGSELLAHVLPQA
jgi:hypothetical protein